MNHAVLDWLEGQRDAMTRLLGDIVSIDSASHDKAGVDRVGARIRTFLEENGVACEVERLSDRGDALHAYVGGQGGNAPVLLTGHMDTVFPPDETTRRPFRVEGNLGYGPGCADMKAGLVMNAFILVGFAKHGGAPVPVHGLFTGDEEIGSRASRPIIEATAKGARAVFNAEPGRVNGNVVKGRRGGSFFKARLTGRASHAGLNPHDGRSAIHEMARKILAWTDLNDDEKQISVNVGLVSGGQAVNTVAPDAEAQIDLRFSRHEDGEEAEQAIRAIADSHAEDGLSARVEKLGGFLPMLQSEGGDTLTAAYLDAAKQLGQLIDAEFTPSCADSGFTTTVGTPTVCATGPVGGKVHSPDEYVDLNTLVPRARVVALTVLRMRA